MKSFGNAPRPRLGTKTSARWLSTAGLAALGLLALGAPRFAHSDTSTSGGTSTTTSISLDNDGLPASDLLYQGKVLYPNDALTLKEGKPPVDLSTLEPNTADEYAGTDTSAQGAAADAALGIAAGARVNYTGTIQSASGHYRFNVQMPAASAAGDGSAVKTLTMIISPQLHGFLLRKLLLRKLGYNIPAAAYLSQVIVHFPDVLTRDDVLKNQIVAATYKAASHWCFVAQSVLDKDKTFPCRVTNAVTDENDVLIQDVVAMDPEVSYYNVMMNQPLETPAGSTTPLLLQQRIMRALAVIYSLVNVPESINQVNWYDGTLQNHSVSLDTGERDNFNCTLDDALWILRKIAKLTEQDFEDIVQSATFPDGVSGLVTQKLISRRDSLMKIFGVQVAALSFDSNYNDPPNVLKGKVQCPAKNCQADWPGYASRFAWGDPASPLQGLGYYALAEGISNALNAAIDKANEEIPQLTEEAAQQNEANKLEQQAFTQLLTTGVVQKIPFGVWFAPIASGGVTVSRDIVLGDYLGTNNLVQLADTFGFQANAGLYIGINGLPAATTLSGLVQGSVGITWTHIKPLTSLKSGVTENPIHMATPMLFLQAASVLNQMGNEKNNQNTQTSDQIKKALGNYIDELKNFLGPGDSLILTESIYGSEAATFTATAPVALSPAISASIADNQVVLSRLHFYRETGVNSNTVQVFKDNGELSGPQLSFEFSLGSTALFPVITVEAERLSGSAKSKIYTVNIDSDTGSNPNVYANAAALAAAIKTGSTDALDGLQKPSMTQVGFQDSDSSFNFLHYSHRTLKTNGQVKIQLPDGTRDSFISLTDGKQSGARYQGLATDAATYLVDRLSGSTTYGINTQVNPNPGQSFLGHSQTRDTDFQARVTSAKSLDPTSPYVRIQYRWEGWNESQKDMVSLVASQSAKYGCQIFPAGFLNDTKDVKLYELSVALNFYTPAVNQVLAMTPAAEKSLEKSYSDRNRCELLDEGDGIQEMTGAEEDACAALDNFESAFSTYRKGIQKGFKTAMDEAQAIFKIMANLEAFADFSDVEQLVGGKANFYISASMTGFREGSETLSDPINSQPLGTMQPNMPGGVVDAAESILNIQDGEFSDKWIRETL